MELKGILKNMKGTIILQVEGFYVERFINVCKIQNVEIWEVKHITVGLIELKTKTNSFKNIKKIAKKTKCRVKIKRKKGIYFILFKYKKRRLFAYLTVLTCVLLSILSTFILNIDITGNKSIEKKIILKELKKAGLSKWKNKLFIDKNKIKNYLRANMYEIAWVGMKIEGTTAKVEIVEKIVKNEDLTKNLKGDIITSKSGVITKIIAENGTPLFLTGSYIEKDMVAISGLIQSEILGDMYVHAKGILKIKNEYEYEIIENYVVKNKVYNEKNKFGIGININNKEYVLKYLPKKVLYDINKKEKKITLFSKKIKFVFNKYRMYELETTTRDYEKLVKICEEKYKKYLKKSILQDSKLLDEKVVIKKEKNGIRYRVNYTIEENVRKI